MINLETAVSESPVQSKEESKPTELYQPGERGRYDGLNLVKDEVFKGGTSIKYWM
jgi:hypothetical protein